MRRARRGPRATSHHVFYGNPVPVVCRRSSKDADWLVEWAGTHRPVVGVKRAGVRMLAFMRIDGLLLWTGG
ncbi:hypothetical protein KCMC57_up58170 [Kitasatospora sp. CMC57]|uniref:Uncharacterized protein n=1 Tax=Kitasatospora sp. CMC57 TaxID=3231513 RepID=A0AB33K6F0_9ACTN